MIKVLDNSIECYMNYVMAVISIYKNFPEILFRMYMETDFLVHFTGKKYFQCISEMELLFFGLNGNFVFCLLFKNARATPKPFMDS